MFTGDQDSAANETVALIQRTEFITNYFKPAGSGLFLEGQADAHPCQQPIPPDNGMHDGPADMQNEQGVEQARQENMNRPGRRDNVGFQEAGNRQ